MKVLEYGTTQVELIDRTIEVTRVGCKFSRVRSIEQQSFRGRAARAVVGGKLGHASSAGGDHGLSEDRLIHRAMEAAQVDVPASLSFPGSVISITQADPILSQMSESDLRDVAEDILRIISRGQPGVAIELEVRRVREFTGLRNSNGGQVNLSHVWLEGEAWVERHLRDDVFVVSDSFTSARAGGSHREFARRIARRLRWARQPVKPQPGPQSVILSPGAFGSLLRPMLHRLNGTHAAPPAPRSSRRPAGFAGRIGQPLFDPRFSLSDDATLPDRPRSAPVDHEGTPAQRTALIERGVVKGFYHNLHSAALAGAGRTGNGWRSMMEPPRPTPTSVVVGRGDTRLVDMLKRLNDGLLIDAVMNSDAAAGLRGDFSRTVALAYQVRHGRVTGFVRGVGAGGNLYKSLKQIEALSCDGYWSDNLFAPYLQIGGVTITV